MFTRSTRSWSVLLGSALAVLASTAAVPPQPPADSSPGTASPEATEILAWWRGGRAPAGGRFGGRRDDGAFAIAPGSVDGMNLIWHDRPLLIWDGVIGQVEILDEASGEQLWSQTVSAGDRSVAYSGAALQPGQSYEWLLRDALGVSIDLVTFELLPPEERDQIAAELAELATAAATTEELALQRANYFAERQLWADVLQEALAVAAPSPELAELQAMLLSRQVAS